MAVANVNIEKIIPLKEVEYRVPSEKQRHHTRVQYEHDFRKEFLQYIAEHFRDELKESGLWDSIIDRTLARGKTPPGWGVHHKIPIHGGGKNQFENMIFIRFAEHFKIHRYIDNYIEGMEEGNSRVITIPYPLGMVHVPEKHMEGDSFVIKKPEETLEMRKARIEKNRRQKKKEYAERFKH